jgi:hypothetical protein
MTTIQLFFSLIGVMVTLGIAFTGFLKYYIDAKIDPISKNVDTLVQYMVSHEGRIGRLEERTKNL